MGWGYQHTPFYIPDPRDPYDVAESVVTHAAYGFASWSIAYALGGSNPGPGHLGTLYRAFLSPAHVGASYAGTNAFDDTMFALRTYARPFGVVARASIPFVVLTGALVAVKKANEFEQQLASQGMVSPYQLRNRETYFS